MKLELLAFPFRLIFRPFHCFWELKYENKGRLKIAYGILFILVIAEILRRQYAGFLVNYEDPRFLNSIDELKFIVFPFFLWCVSNWSLTALMDGEGKFTEIMMATGYAVMPLVLVYLPNTLVSNFMNGQEVAFYYFFNLIAMGWFLWLAFVGMMTIHQYTPGKTIVTMLLTVVVIGIILFLGLLFFSLIQQVIFFFQTIYREIIFWS
ncbi:Yip1 family protein [Paenibacillus spongiae]|uniref:YIP1 family protein n=1 Tax=Paenibacillus spongiae TaxID=2909671 RepID=A0ABY5SH48_9BACL|nr:Yip1 family protein [Paenibacillus spongiae]UVI31983.1 YIP1 family protein [Paenibacillus spongiae]